MKNRKHLILFGVVLLGFILGSIALNSQNNQGDKNEAQTDNLNQPSKDIDSKTPRTSGAWELNNITIDDDGGTPGAMTWLEANDTLWCSGGGTWQNPYVIENVTINVTNSPTNCGIIIKDSDVPFIIRNCTVYNSGTYLHEGGIKLENTNNGNLTENNCSNNGRNGILLYNDCYNNTISGNTVNNCNVFGISLQDGCENNTISNNRANDNNEVGMYLYSSNENTVFNNTFSNTIAGYAQNYGVRVLDGSENTISNNTVNGNTVAGLNIVQCYNNVVANNTINSNGNTDTGILLDYCGNTELSGNKMYNCGIKLDGVSSTVNSHTIFTNNTVNGKSVIYYADESNLDTTDFTKAGDPGQIILANCSDSTISGFNLSYSTLGIELTYSENITVSNNSCDYNRLYGIYLTGECYNNNIFNNTVNDNGQIGIYLLDNCDRNYIFDNNITNNGQAGSYDGMYLRNSEQNTITGNRIMNNTDDGVELFQSCHNLINENVLILNVDAGIYLLDSDHNSIIENTAKNNTYGLIFEDSSYNCVYGNTLVNNTYNYKEIGNSNLNRDCRKLIPPAPDDDDDDDDETGIVIVIIIIVVLACIGTGGAIVFILIKKRHNRLIQT